MSQKHDIQRLEGLAQLMLDHRLGRLREAADLRDRSRMQLRAVNAAAEPADLPPVAAGLVGIAYQRWADVRRAELNAVIARQTVDWMQARAEAGNALGRMQALRGVAEMLQKRR